MAIGEICYDTDSVGVSNILCSLHSNNSLREVFIYTLEIIVISKVYTFLEIMQVFFVKKSNYIEITPAIPTIPTIPS